MTNYSVTDPWTLYAVTYTTADNTLRIYRDGTLSNSRVVSGLTIGTNSLFLGFGAQLAGTTPTASSWYKGSLDDIRIYKRALSASEIQALYSNHAPVAIDDSYTTPVNTTLAESAPGVLNNDTDADTGDTLAAILVSNPTHGSVALNSDGSFTYTPVTDYSGSDSFTYRAIDKWGTSSNAATVSITVGQPNHPPVVTNPGPQASSEGQVVSLQISASDPDTPLIYSATGLPEGLGIDTGTGEIAGTITYHAGEASPYAVTITVADSLGGSTPVNFTWTVNQAASGLCSDPTAGLVGCWPMEENAGTVLIDATAYGNDGNLTGSPSWVTGKTGAYALYLNGSTNALVPDDPSLDIANQITLAAWVKPEQTTTQNLIKKAVNSNTNGYELSLAAAGSAADQKYFVRFNQTTSGDTYRVNSTMKYPADGSTWVHVAATYDGTTIRLYLAGVLNNSLTPTTPPAIVTNNLSLGIGADSNGANRYKGAMDDARIYNRALNLQQIETLAGVNRTPVLNAIGNKAVDELAPLTFTATASDLDSGDALSFSLDAAAPTGASIHPTTGAFTWTPAEDQGPGSYPVTVKVCDNGTPVKCDEEAITVTVDEVNVAPMLDAIGNKSMAEGNELSFTAMASDVDLPAKTLTFSLVNGTSGSVPEGAAITAGGAFTWTPTEAHGPGSYTFDVCVSDGALSDCETLTVTVSEVNLAPVLAAIGAKAVAEQTLLSFTATASDVDLPAQTLIFSLAAGTSGSVPTGAAITAGGAFTWTPTEAQGPGSYTFDVCVSDGALSDCETIVVTVSEVNVAPVLGAIDDQSVEELAPLSFTATASDVDRPAQTLTFSLVGAPTGASIDPMTGVFTWTPADDQVDFFYFDVCVSDGVAAPVCQNILVEVYDRPPTVTLAKLVDKTTLPEPGGAFNFTLRDHQHQPGAGPALPAHRLERVGCGSPSISRQVAGAG